MTKTTVAELNSKVENLEATNVQLVEIVDSLSAKVTTLEQNLQLLSAKQAFLEILQQNHNRMIDDNEQYSRKQNLIIAKFPIKKNDNDDFIRNKVIEEFSKVDSDIIPRDIDRAHRTGRPFTDSNGKSYCPIIVRFSSWYARNLIYSKRNQLTFKVKADLTNRREDLLNYARNQLNAEGSIAAKYIDFVFPDRNCRIGCKSKDNRTFTFNSKEEFERTVTFVMESQPPYEAIWRALEHDHADEGSNIVNVRGRDINLWLENAPGHVYIGRQITKEGKVVVTGSKWKNPFSLSEYNNDREKVLSLYNEHVVNTPELFNDLGSLRNKRLGCFCAPEKCHAEVLHKLVGNIISYVE